MDVSKSAAFNHLGVTSSKISKNKGVCIYWLKGKCRRNPCRFLHSEPAPSSRCWKRGPYVPRKNFCYVRTKNTPALKIEESELGSDVTGAKKSSVSVSGKHSEDGPMNSLESVAKNSSKDRTENVQENLNNETSEDLIENSLETVAANSSEDLSKDKENLNNKTSEDLVKKSLETVAANSLEDLSKDCPKSICESCADSNCVRDDQFLFLHSPSCGDGLTILAKLQGHEKAVTGIVLTENNKLLSGSSDGTVHVWDCLTAKCAHINVGAEVGSIISVGAWVFVGMPNVVKVWNTGSGAEYNLDGPAGQVYAMAVTTTDKFFAGGQDGVILVWKGSWNTNPPLQLAASLKGHTCDIVSLVIGGDNLYSGSKDHTIRVWDHESLQCIRTLEGHTDTVTSLIFCETYLLSCSLDRTIKAWPTSKEGNLDVFYTHNEEHGVLALSRMTDAEDKHLLYCSYSDNSVQIYGLPSFADRGRLLSKHEVRSMQSAPRGHGVLFIGDQSGLVTVWKVKPVH
ncbi:Zinc finger CCCH domain-containing protein 17 [Morella rubra]|uniref:Zinc finger CCCH domain-containing protein 17 n=1 Tax=Morella rubra TaxID=262757 RepID=A0A6A1USM7_9ROSI|nr:Zinc finger CCCH domain-containing protein 17 [Morella rubra]